MCGIAGAIGAQVNNNANKLSEVFCDSLNHRGPDANGTWHKDNVLLAHTRLSIIDIDNRSNQPMVDPTKRYTLVFNGEIYNYNQIKPLLKEYPFKTNSDTEVLLAAWIKWGVDCLSKLNGMFAFSIWDNQEKEMHLCRDRLGIKPIYFYNGSNNFVFASELRTLLKTDLVPKKINKDCIYEFFKYQTVHAPRTIVKDVQMVPAGHYLKVSETEVSSVEYWNAASNKSTFVSPKKEAVQNEISSLLTSAVEYRMISDVPLGAFLSGGIDSSLLVAIIREKLNLSLSTFSIVFDEREFSEAPYSSLVAKRFNTQHHEIELKSTDFLQTIGSAIEAMDHPSGDGPNSYVVSQAVKKAGLTVALSGLGGDELFAGYPFFKNYHSLQQKKHLLSFPKYARQFVAQPLKRFKNNVQGHKLAEILLLPYFDIPHTYPVNRRVLSDSAIRKLYNNAGKDELFYWLKDEFSYGTGAYNLPSLSQVSYVELTTYMQNVLLRDSDQMSMAHALEIRVPFLDHRLVEYAMAIPDKFKYPNYAKELLVSSFQGLLPDEIVHREKMGFVLPWENWLKKDLKPFAIEGLSHLANYGFNKQETDNLFKAFEQGNSHLTWSRIWPAITLGHWLKNNNIEA